MSSVISSKPGICAHVFGAGILSGPRPPTFETAPLPGDGVRTMYTEAVACAGGRRRHHHARLRHGIVPTAAYSCDIVVITAPCCTRLFTLCENVRFRVFRVGRRPYSQRTPLRFNTTHCAFCARPSKPKVMRCLTLKTTIATLTISILR